MQLLPMYLAFLFGTALLATTTDAAPRGSKKDDDSPSLGRIRMLMVGKHVGGNTDTDAGTKNGGPKKMPKPLDDDDDANLPDAESTCNILEAFDNMGHDENKMVRADGQIKWKRLCDDFDSVDQMLCPTDDAVAAICAYQVPHNNPAVKHAWCIPVYGMMEDTERSAQCIKYCTNYVSAAKGGCCDIDCGDGVL
jgi:hypothetical protein